MRYPRVLLAAFFAFVGLAIGPRTAMAASIPEIQGTQEVSVPGGEWWKVDDEATKALMVKFFELWNPRDGSKGLGAAAALKEAQAFVAAQPKWKHPEYWAAWVLWGLPE